MAAVVLEKFPAVHFKHVPDPKWPLTVPTGHAVQLPPSGPSYPALHLHPLQPCAECAFCGHAWHVVAAVELEYSPAEPSTHADDPSAALNVPKHVSARLRRKGDMQQSEKDYDVQ